MSDDVSKLRGLLVFISCGLIVLLVNIDVTIVNLGLPIISHYFDVSLNQVKWIVSGYLLITAITFVLFGKLADDIGRKRVYLLGILSFTIGSVLAGMANDFDFLIFARLIQGLGFSATAGLSVLIILQHSSSIKRGYVMGVIVTLTGAGQAIGPFFGGLLLQYFSWRDIFFINVPICITSLLLGYYFISADKCEGKFNNLNITNVALFFLGLGGLLYTFSEFVSFSISWITLLTSSILCLVGFVYTSFRFDNPLIDLSLLKNVVYLRAISIRLIFMVCTASFFFMTPIYMQNIINFSPTKTGSLMLMSTIMLMIFGPLTGKFIDKHTFHLPLMLSLLLALVATICMFFWSGASSWFMLVFGLIIFGIAMGIHIPSSTNAAVTTVSAKKSGSAIGLFFTSATTGSVLGIALCTVVINYISSYSVQYLLQESKLVLTRNQEKLTQFAAKGIQNPNHILHNIALRHLARHAYLNAFHFFLGIQLILLLFSIVICSLNMKNSHV
jgi:EmrB/QacA subfamily drug resistance transporter